jgi:transcriptional regulator with XRE-family HTH domain
VPKKAQAKSQPSIRVAEGRRVLASNIRRIRKAKGLSQEILAFYAGLDRSYMSKIERGAPNTSIDNIYRIAEALSIDVRELFVPLPPEIVARERRPRAAARPH